MAVTLQARLLSVTDLCVHAGVEPLLDTMELPGGHLDQVCSTLMTAHVHTCSVRVTETHALRTLTSVMPNYARAITAGLSS